MKEKFIDPLFEEVLAKVPKEIDYEIDYLFDIAGAIYDTMRERGLSQTDFAKLMGKKDSEVSRWLQGTHNFTVQTIAKISAVLKTDILKKAFASKPVNKWFLVINETPREKLSINNYFPVLWKSSSRHQFSTRY